MVKIRLEFSDKDLEKALALYFKIKPEQITFWHIRSVIGNGHCLEYRKED